LKRSQVVNLAHNSEKMAQQFENINQFTKQHL